MMFSVNRLLVAAGVSFAAVCGTLSVGAASGLAAQARADAPKASVEVYGDWVSRCVNTPEKGKVCEAEQTLFHKEDRKVFLQVAIGKPVADKPAVLILQVPTDVYLREGPELFFDEAMKDGIQATYTVCNTKCFAATQLTEKQLKRIEQATGNGRISFVNGKADGGHLKRIVAPISFKGLNDAISASFKK